jgi:hypothetical protein
MLRQYYVSTSLIQQNNKKHAYVAVKSNGYSPLRDLIGACMDRGIHYVNTTLILRQRRRPQRVVYGANHRAGQLWGKCFSAAMPPLIILRLGRK